MARFKTKRIDFDQATIPADVVFHRVYYKAGTTPDYLSPFTAFGISVDPIVPTDLAGFPLGTDVYVGVTAINTDGHESDMGMYADPFDFTAPPVPIFQVVDG
jgi:hypothetical protein